MVDEGVNNNHMQEIADLSRLHEATEKINALFKSVCIFIFVSLIISSLSLLPSMFPKLLVIGTLSDQNNFEERQSIRDTWQRLAMDQQLQHYFVIGNYACKIPLKDRISPFGCEELNISLSQTEELTTNRPSLPQQLHRYSTLFIGFSFITHHRIVIRRLNILKDVLIKTNAVRICLVDSTTKERIVFASFTQTNIESDGSVLVSKNVEPFILPRGFEGQIVVETFEPMPLIKECPLAWNNASGLLTFLQLISSQHQKPISFDSDSCSAASMTFDIYDVNELKHHIQSRSERQTAWNIEVATLHSKLLSELEDKEDILLVDVVDVYRNLPNKLLLFFEWVNNNVQDFSYVMKTDDDSFINVPKVLSELLSLQQASTQLSRKLWWWGSFREQWSVSISGKWREDVYRSLTYPPFPCGAAYVVNRDMVTYLAANAKTLQTNFQGEDVAMGIWLAGLQTEKHFALPFSSANPAASKTDLEEPSCNTQTESVGKVETNWCRAKTDTLAEDNRANWGCDAMCENDAYSRAQLSIEDMFSTWNTYNQCGSLCNCSSPIS